MRFTKMHGIGNDYIFVNGFAERVADPASVAVAVSDRHFGIGADGLVLILPSDRADVRMRMFNADGSEAEMCGNAVRCVAKYAFERGICQNNPMRVETGRGILTLMLQFAAGRVQGATVDMGLPLLQASQIPTTLAPAAERVIDVPLPADLSAQLAAAIATPADSGWMQASGLLTSGSGGGARPLVTCVSMGNPHAVFYCTDVAKIPLWAVGPLIENAAIFPRRVNAHFVQIASPDRVTVRTWERGSGITLACGTGACAVCVAGVLTGRGGPKLTANLPGGELTLDWSSTRSVLMTGPAVEVFSGDWAV